MGVGVTSGVDMLWLHMMTLGQCLHSGLCVVRVKGKSKGYNQIGNQVPGPSSKYSGLLGA